MKLHTLLTLAVFVLSTNALASPLGAMNGINCQYNDNGQTKKPVVFVHNDTEVSHGEDDDFDKITKMTISVAYLINGQRVIENATVSAWDRTGSNEAFTSRVRATGDQSGRKIEIDFKNFGGPSAMSVDGQPQTQMQNLQCTLDLSA